MEECRLTEAKNDYAAHDVTFPIHPECGGTGDFRTGAMRNGTATTGRRIYIKLISMGA